MSLTPTLQVDITISGSTTTEISGGCSQNQVGEIQLVGIQGVPGEIGPSSTGDISLLSGQIISLSGDLYLSGSNLLNKINIISGNLQSTGSYILSLLNGTGNFTGLFYPLQSNPSGYLNDLSASGFITTNMTGNFYPNYNPSGFITGINTGNFATTQNLELTGINLQAQINQININTGNFNNLFYPRNENPSGYLSSLSGALTGFNSGDYVLKSETGQFANKLDLIESGFNLNNKIISLSGDLLLTGLSLLNEINIIKTVTGINIEGRNGIIVTTGLNNNFTISGSGFATTLDLFSSGQNLLGKINSLSGDLITSGNNLYNFIISLSGNLLATGESLNNKINIISGNLILSGIDILNRIISLSGDLIASGRNLDNKILSLSGDLLNTGQNLQNQINLIKNVTGVQIIAGTNTTVITGGPNIFTINSTASGSSSSGAAGVSSLNGLTGNINLLFGGSITGIIVNNDILISGNNLISNGRLSFDPFNPLYTGDYINQSMLYLLPFNGNVTSLIFNNKWTNYLFTGAQLNISTFNSGKNFDIFEYYDGNKVSLDYAEWSNDTDRISGLSLIDGIFVNQLNNTRKYIGCLHTVSSGLSVDTERQRFLVNQYNKIEKKIKKVENAPSWTYTLTTPRQANGNTDNQIEVLLPISGDKVSLHLFTVSINGSNNSRSTAIGVNGILPLTNDENSLSSFTAGFFGNQICKFNGQPKIGYNYFTWLESSQAIGTTTWFGKTSSFGVTGNYGLFGNIIC